MASPARTSPSASSCPSAPSTTTWVGSTTSSGSPAGPSWPRSSIATPDVRTLTAAEAAAEVRPDDSIGLPLGPGQPIAYLEALGERTDWTGLEVYGALLSVFTELFSHPNVSYLSGFFGPLERMLLDAG